MQTIPEPLFPQTITISLFVPGVVVVGAKQLNWQFFMPFTATAKECILVANTGPTGAALIVNVEKNGAGMYAAGDRPRIADGSTSGSSTVLTTKNLSRGDLISFNVDQVGNVVAGSDLEIELIVIKDTG